jgi:hypothetical protein|tara:strand:- start:310 stop:513 length:204 start_codon:yes stop_codon:yes gene_type:complete
VIEPTTSLMPTNTWAKHNNVEVVKYDRKNHQEHRLQTVFKTIYYEFADGKVKLNNYVSNSSTINFLV